jgi:hypothetical protein
MQSILNGCVLISIIQNAILQTPIFLGSTKRAISDITKT